MRAGYRVAQVRMIFSLSERAKAQVFYNDAQPPPSHLAYVEWFDTLTAEPNSNLGFHCVKRTIAGGERVASIVPVEWIRRSVHLTPRFGRVLDRTWTSTTVLKECSEFYINQFSDKHAYITIR